MDSCNYKLCHEHDFDSRSYLENYFSDSPEMIFAEDSLVFPIENLKKTFTEGHIKGDILIDLSLGSVIHHLYSACEFFNNIIVLKASNRCIMELKRWADTRTGAFYWGHATKLHADTEEVSEPLQDKEEKVRLALQHVVKCDYSKENMTDPIVLPPADCIISVWLLDAISRDQNDYITYLRRFTKLLKPGGRLILFGDLEITYFTVGTEKFHAFCYNEDFVRKALEGEGFVIDCCKVRERTSVSDLLDHKGVIFIAAHRKN
ncbi:nicotinamide N-methyltransferase-like [Bufo bufo]|uniref:nicotinamide N-methyltransferase-like n=1 Tax=Bufo bufo TaxID=8384 RepID=UPI001ABE5DB5|nr:nicotinamide N-methyltransferase-like [Bufo bufo]